jgi:transcriptional regulator with XRE-family HTH domain
MNTVNLGNRIKTIIKNKGLLQRKVAMDCGYSDSQLSNMIHGKKTIKPKDVVKLCKGLNVSPNELFGYDCNKTA